MTGSADSARLAEEIRLLVDMVVERAAPWLEALVEAGHGPRQEHGDTAGRDTGFAWCPLCSVVAVVRGERPERAARLLEQAAQLIALLRAVLADRWAPEEGFHMPGFQPRSRSGPEPHTDGRARRVQHVAVHPREQWER